MDKINLCSLSSNLISFIYKFLPFKDILQASQVSRKMYKALLNDYIWEEFVKYEELFIPGQGENFSSWRNYFKYLKELKENIRPKTNKKKYKMIPYRGHKAIITALNYFLLSNELTSVIVSGDESGILNTWKLDEDGDYEPDTINDTKSEIVDIKIYDNILITWNRQSNFYIYKLDLNSTNNNIKFNSERFKLLYQKNISIKNIDIKYIDWINNEETIICSVDLNRKGNLKDGAVIFTKNCINDKDQTFHLTNDFDQLNLIREKNLNDDPDEDTINKNGDHKTFIYDGDLIIVYSNFEFTKYHFVKRYNSFQFGKKGKLDNLYILNRKTVSKYGFNLPFDYIYNIIKLENGNFSLLGFKDNNILYGKYIFQNNSLKNNSFVNINVNSKPHDVYLLYYENNMFSILLHGNMIINKNLNSPENTISFLENEGGRINCVAGDKYRLIIGTEGMAIGVYRTSNASVWYYLLGGSKTVVPKSFIKNPHYEGFNLLKVSRNSIIGVLGNLIREYSFQPSIN